VASVIKQHKLQENCQSNYLYHFKKNFSNTVAFNFTIASQNS